MGFGSASGESIDPSEVLLRIDMPSQERSFCDSAYSVPLQKNPRDTSHLLCYGYLNDRRKLVHFDAGAPVLDPVENKVFGVALTSVDLEKDVTQENFPVFVLSLVDVRERLIAAMDNLGNFVEPIQTLV